MMVLVKGGKDHSETQHLLYVTASGRELGVEKMIWAGFADNMVLLAKWSDDLVASGKEVLSAHMYESTHWSLGL